MLQYGARRLLTSIPVLVGIVVVVFVLARLIPGGACKAMLGEKATEAACERFDRANGLDKPVINCIKSVRPLRFGGCFVNPVETQLFIYAGQLLRGDFGQSIRFSRPVSIILVEQIPTTIELSLAALALAVLIGVPAGILSAIRHNSAVDIATMAGANIGVSMPVFWLGLMLAFLFSIVIPILPPSGRISAGLTAEPFYQVWGLYLAKGTAIYTLLEFFSNLYILNSILTLDFEVLFDVLKHLILPAAALSTIPLSIIARMTRSSLLEVLGQEYIRAAKAKGVPRVRLVVRHALRNALLPVVTIIGLSLGGLLGGAVLTETVFKLSGVGRILFEAITARDYPIIQAFTLVIAVSYVVINMIVDISYSYLDPRIRLQ
ncbi:MAG TPA: ABC transporter permease [Anaerolineales bacterium]|nr:ABC transporter permease [Anaerolineales bacterium]